ncbi:hypothetical protein AB0K09_02500 [Streptomyces sp. NPDC049577]|uniref:hypothetical protein n=1 Tax=Streptomyces sp. NPDC049577 TaxID=3155153 RepID=UPI003447CCDB
MEMSRQRRGPLSADPQFRTVYAPDDYARHTGTAVAYVPVIQEGVVLGHLWASPTDDAAGFVPAPAAGAAGLNAGVRWIGRLRQAKAEGLTALEALRYWTGRAGDDPRAGSVPAGSECEAPGLGALAGR